MNRHGPAHGRVHATEDSPPPRASSAETHRPLVDFEEVYGGDVDAIGVARKAVERALEPYVDDRRMSDVALLVSELATNALVHGKASHEKPFAVLAQLTPTALRLEVHDQGPGFVVPEVPKPREIGGLGLVLVHQLSNRWGADCSSGARVWLEMDGVYAAAEG